MKSMRWYFRDDGARWRFRATLFLITASVCVIGLLLALWFWGMST